MGNGQTVAYISDVGSSAPQLNSGLQPLFIAMSTVAVVTFDLAFLCERWLRHRALLEPNTTRSEKILSVLAIVFAIAGAAGIILLSIFDTYHYPRTHDGCLLLFIAGYILTAIFVTAEYQRLGIHVRQQRLLRISFWIKLTFILIELALAIAFVVENFTGSYNNAAILEWVIAFIFTFWILSFVIDLLPALRKAQRKGPNESDEQMEGGMAEHPQSSQQTYTNGGYDSRY